MNVTAAAYVAHLNKAIAEIQASNQTQQFGVGFWPPDAARQKAMLAEAVKLLEIALVDLPETDQPVSPT